MFMNSNKQILCFFSVLSIFDIIILNIKSWQRQRVERCTTSNMAVVQSAKSNKKESKETHFEPLKNRRTERPLCRSLSITETTDQYKGKRC